MKALRQIDTWLAPGEQLRSWLDPVFRIATSLIFIIGGIGHFAAHDYMLGRMAESPWRDAVATIGDPSWLLWLHPGGSGKIHGLLALVPTSTRYFRYAV